MRKRSKCIDIGGSPRIWPRQTTTQFMMGSSGLMAPRSHDLGFNLHQGQVGKYLLAKEDIASKTIVASLVVL